MFSEPKIYFNCNLNIFFCKYAELYLEALGSQLLNCFFTPLYEALSEGIQ